MEKLLAFATLGQHAYGRLLFQRFLSRAILVVGLVVIIAILASALLIGLLFIAYTALLQQGFDSVMAALIVSAITLLMIAMLTMAAVGYVRHQCQLPRSFCKQSPLVARINDVVDAFMDGLMEK